MRSSLLFTLLIFSASLSLAAGTLTGVFKDVAPADHGALVEQSKTAPIMVLYYLPDCHICHSAEEKLAELAIERQLHERVFTMDATKFDDPEIETLPVVRVYSGGNIIDNAKGRFLGLKGLIGKM